VLREVVLGGEFPFWNRAFAAGQPLAANPEHEVFYPLTWLILLPDYETGFRLLVVLHVYLALFAMYALLRSMELRPPAAFFGALAYGLGGMCLSQVNLLPLLLMFAWLPLTCLLSCRPGCSWECTRCTVTRRTAGRRCAACHCWAWR
jgi:hypothetical protein